jgi:hypothetical protein
MDNFMEQPTYKMNRGAILTQGWRRLVCRLQQYETAIGLAGSFEHLPALDKRQSSSRNPSQRGGGIYSVWTRKMKISIPDKTGDQYSGQSPEQ